jgi:hypothetical protein
VRDLEELNINEGGRPVKRPAPTAEHIRAFERKFGVRLAQAHVVLLKHANGGHPELNVFYKGDCDWGVDVFLHLSDEDAHPSGLWRAMADYGGLLGEACIPFAFDGGGNVFYVDAGSVGAPVWLWLHHPPERVFLAPSFEAFVDGLRGEET